MSKVDDVYSDMFKKVIKQKYRHRLQATIVED